MTRREAAPITPDRLASRREHLMTEILQAPRAVPAKPSRRPLRLAVAGLTVAALTAGITVYANTGGGRSGNGPAAFAVETLPTGPVRITVLNQSDLSAQQMTRQLHAQGLDISITTLASNAQVAGEWLTYSSDGKDPVDDAVVEAQMQGQPHQIEIPPGLLRHPIDFGVARLARPGEKIAVAGLRNALRPAGPLFCLRLAGADPAVAEQRLTAAGYRVHFDARAGDWRTATASPPTGRVVQAYLWDPVMGISGTVKDVYVSVLEPTSTRYAGSVWQGWPKAQQTSGVPDYSSC